jgi:hypothetical protein
MGDKRSGRVGLEYRWHWATRDGDCYAAIGSCKRNGWSRLSHVDSHDADLLNPCPEPWPERNLAVFLSCSDPTRQSPSSYLGPMRPKLLIGSAARGNCPFPPRDFSPPSPNTTELQSLRRN